jgi:hypothetical protein
MLVASFLQRQEQTSAACDWTAAAGSAPPIQSAARGAVQEQIKWGAVESAAAGPGAVGACDWTSAASLAPPIQSAAGGAVQEQTTGGAVSSAAAGVGAVGASAWTAAASSAPPIQSAAESPTAVEGAGGAAAVTGAECGGGGGGESDSSSSISHALEIRSEASGTVAPAHASATPASATPHGGGLPSDGDEVGGGPSLVSGCQLSAHQPISGSDCLGRLLLDFLHFFGTVFDARRSYVSLRVGGTYPVGSSSPPHNLRSTP